MIGQTSDAKARLRKEAQRRALRRVRRKHRKYPRYYGNKAGRGHNA